MNKLEKRVEKLEDFIESLHWRNSRVRQEILRIEKGTLHIIACGAVGHTFKLISAFINRENGNRRYGKFVCTNCNLGIERPLTTKEENAAKELGMPV